MNALDLTVILFVIASGVWSYMKGFIREVMGLVALIVSFSLAWIFSGVLADALVRSIPYYYARNVFAFLALFVILFVALSLIVRLIARFAPLPKGAQIAGRLGASSIGVIKALLLLIVLAFPAVISPAIKHSLNSGSVTAPVIISMSDALYSSIAPGAVGKLKDLIALYEEYREALREGLGILAAWVKFKEKFNALVGNFDSLDDDLKKKLAEEKTKTLEKAIELKERAAEKIDAAKESAAEQIDAAKESAAEKIDAAKESAIEKGAKALEKLQIGK